MENAILVIDEVDATKETIQDALIEEAMYISNRLYYEPSHQSIAMFKTKLYYHAL